MTPPEFRNITTAEAAVAMAEADNALAAALAFGTPADRDQAREQWRLSQRQLARACEEDQRCESCGWVRGATRLIDFRDGNRPFLVCDRCAQLALSAGITWEQETLW
jgi:hypothetical protein